MRVSNVRFELDIDSANQAMVEDPREEIARMLRETAEAVLDGSDKGKLMDINGNKVGSYTVNIEEEDEEDDEIDVDAFDDD